MTQRTIRRLGGWAGAFCTIVLLVVYALNLPFCAGAEWPRCQWRIEEGRLMWTEGEARARNPFWVATGSGRLRFAWDWRRPAPGVWAVTVPLWAPTLLVAGATAAALWPRRRKLWQCAICGYDLRGLERSDACPECGKRQVRD